MTKPYPTIAEVEKATGTPELCWDRLDPLHLIKTVCDLDREHREDEAQESIPWAEYPWAKWAAKDADGHVYMYEGIPRLISDAIQWIDSSPMRVCHAAATIPGPWQESLRTRPEGV